MTISLDVSKLKKVLWLSFKATGITLGGFLVLYLSFMFYWSITDFLIDHDKLSIFLSAMLTIVECYVMVDFFDRRY